MNPILRFILVSEKFGLILEFSIVICFYLFESDKATGSLKSDQELNNKISTFNTL